MMKRWIVILILLITSSAWADSLSGVSMVGGSLGHLYGTLDQSQTVLADSDLSDYGLTGNGRKFGQTFQPSVTASVSAITVAINRVNDPTDSARLQIYSDGVTGPGDLLATADNDILGSTLIDYVEFPDNPSYVTYIFTGGPTLSANTTYWIVFSRTGTLNNTNRYCMWGSRDTPDQYTRGEAWVQLSDDSWNQYSSPPTDYEDVYFLEYHN